jgi:hypothetical protein
MVKKTAIRRLTNLSIDFHRDLRVLRALRVGCGAATVLLAVAVSLAAGCGKTAEPGPTTPTSPITPNVITPVARAHLDQLLSLMQANSINRL